MLIEAKIMAKKSKFKMSSKRLNALDASTTD